MKIVAVVVTYNPSLERFGINLQNIASQVDRAVVVDNSENPDKIESLRGVTKNIKNCSYISLGVNRGIGYAQNVGIAECFKLDADFVVTFDQDSKISDAFVVKLLESFKNGERSLGKGKIACVGPFLVNQRNNKVYQNYLSGAEEVASGLFSVKTLASSGTLFPLSIFLSVGLMKASWFIDVIDTEWCYRATAGGFSVLMTDQVSLVHNIGEEDYVFPWGRAIVVSSPFRLYYFTRNSVLSLYEPSFGLRYKLNVLVVLLLRLIVFSCVPPRRERFEWMLLGFRDGILKRDGKI